MTHQTSEASRVRIRRARPSDLARIAELSGQLGYPTTAAAAERRLARLSPDPDHAVLVAEAGSVLVGWTHVFLSHVTMIDDEGEAEVGALVVDEAWRSRGIGRRLLAHAEQWAADLGCRTVRLRSNVIRDRAHAFYGSLGYDLIKAQKLFRKAIAGSRV